MGIRILISFLRCFQISPLALLPLTAGRERDSPVYLIPQTLALNGAIHLLEKAPSYSTACFLSVTPLLTNYWMERNYTLTFRRDPNSTLSSYQTICSVCTPVIYILKVLPEAEEKRSPLPRPLPDKSHMESRTRPFNVTAQKVICNFLLACGTIV